MLNCCVGANNDGISIQPATSPRVISASEFERFLSLRLAVENSDDDEDEDEDEDENDEVDPDTDVVHFSIRYDTHWLKCQPLKVAPLMTVLSLYEDEGDHNLPVHVSPYLVKPARTRSCTCTSPHSSWTYQNLQQEQGENNGHVDSKIFQIRWIDFRTTPESLSGINTQGDVWHFLTSLLGSGHESSPWVNSDGNGSSAVPPSDMVIVVLPRSSQVLRDFRVSDASPSWFFHGYVFLDDCELPSLENQDLMDQMSNVAGIHRAPNSEPQAVLYMYKRLKPRVRLSKHHPIQGVSVLTTKGCLWEMVPPPDQQDDQQDDDTKGLIEPLPTETTYRLVCPPYLNLEKSYGKEICDGLFSPQTLNVFRNEALSIPQWTPWPETQHYSVGPNGETTWTVFPLCYCFPSHDVSKRIWVEQTYQFCSKTCQILEEVLGDRLRTALFSQLAPDTVLEAHTGWADLANHVVRLHIPLVVPPLCGTWVDGCVESHQVGRPLLFDDSKIHRAFNYSNQIRIVLIVDLERPSQMPLGYATGGHSEELDKFISQMSVPK